MAAFTHAASRVAALSVYRAPRIRTHAVLRDRYRTDPVRDDWGVWCCNIDTAQLELMPPESLASTPGAIHEQHSASAGLPLLGAKAAVRRALCPTEGRLAAWTRSPRASAATPSSTPIGTSAASRRAASPRRCQSRCRGPTEVTAAGPSPVRLAYLPACAVTMTRRPSDSTQTLTSRSSTPDGPEGVGRDGCRLPLGGRRHDDVGHGLRGDQVGGFVLVRPDPLRPGADEMGDDPRTAAVTTSGTEGPEDACARNAILLSTDR